MIIPLFRDAPAIGGIYERMDEVFTQLGRPAELVLVDDGSTDGTSQAALELMASFPHPATLVTLSRNFGQHAAVLAGMATANGEVVVTLDSDFQYPPEQVGRLLEALDDGHEVVCGRREHRQDTRRRSLGTAILTWWVSRKSGQALQDVGSMFRAYRRVVVDQLLETHGKRVFIPALTAWLGVPVLEIPVEHQARGEQGSRYSLAKLVELLFDIITGFTLAPLRGLTLAGASGALLAFVSAVALMSYRIAVGSGDAGLVSILAAIFALLGIQLAVMAMLSEYVGRIYLEVRGRPAYLIRTVTSNGPAS